MAGNRNRRKKKVSRGAEANSPATREDRKISVWVWVVLAVILAGVPFAVGKYFELSTPGPFDSGAYVYSAAHLLDGAKLGVDEVSSARPATLLVNVIGVKLFGFSDTGPKILQGFFQLTAFAVMFYTLWRVFGGLAAVLGVFVASFYLSAPLFAKFGNVKEQYMIAMMIVAGCTFMLRQTGGRWWLMLVAGFCATGAYYFKPTGLSVSAAAWLWLVGGAALYKIKWLDAARELGLFLVGTAVGILPILFVYIWQGQASVFFKNVIPFELVRLAVFVAISVFAVQQFMVHRKKTFSIVAAKAKQVRKPVWIFAGVGILIGIVMLSGFYLYFNQTFIDSQGSDQSYIYAQDEGSWYVLDVPFVNFGMRMYYKIYRVFSGAMNMGGYVAESRSHVSLSEQAKVVFRFYGVLVLPVFLGLAGIATAVFKWAISRRKNSSASFTVIDAIAVFLAMWWLLDMAMIWISPRPYEQYYLPLNASAAMLGGYIVWQFVRVLTGTSKGIWAIGGSVAGIAMLIMAAPVVAGVTKSPWTGGDYPHKRLGYIQRFEEVSEQKGRAATGPWQRVGRYIKHNSSEDAQLYVWGWYPGMYVEAQRFSPAPAAFESDMHVKSPQRLGHEILIKVRRFKKDMPEFIVDSRKRHFPNDRPPLELWPLTKAGFLPANRPDIVSQYSSGYKNALRERFGEQEAQRYEVMGQFRDFVMENYEIVDQDGYILTRQGYMHPEFGPHVIFKLKDNASGGK